MVSSSFLAHLLRSSKMIRFRILMFITKDVENSINESDGG